MADRKPLIIDAGQVGQIPAADTLTANQLKSTVVTGTPPLVVASDTKIPNLNADKLDDFHAADLGDRFEARLTLVSGTPIAGANDATTIFLTPFLGNKIRLFDGVNWNLHSLAEISVAVPSTLFRRFDVFVWNNAGVLTLQLENFTEITGTITGATNASPIVITSVAHGLSNGDLVGTAGLVGNTAPNGLIWQTANVTADTFELRSSTGNGAYASGGTWHKQLVGVGPTIVLQDGIPVLSGSPTRRYIGTGMTQGVSGQTSVQGNGRMLLANEYNQQEFSTSISDATNHTYTSTTSRAFNNDGSIQAWIVVPRTGWTFKLIVIGNLSDKAQVDAGLNSSSTIFTGTLINDNAEAIRACMQIPVFRNKGADFFWMLQRSRDGITGTFEEMQLRGIHTR